MEQDQLAAEGTAQQISDIEGVFAKMGLSAYSDRLRFNQPSTDYNKPHYDVVFSNTSNPFVA